MTGRDRPSSEFLSEAQEVVEEFSRNLLELDTQQRVGEFDPDLLNAAFRAIHSLKGLASLFGAGPITALSHALEGNLDALRLGRMPLSPATLDVLFEAVEMFSQMLASFALGDEESVDASRLLERIAQLAGAVEPPKAVGEIAGLDDSIIGVLTEYEEHRLRENVRMGRQLFRVHASFDLLAIDVGIEALKNKMKSFGEVITYLPSADSSSDDRIDLDILLGSQHALDQIAEGVSDNDVSVYELAAGRPAAPPPSPVGVGPEPASVARRRQREGDEGEETGSELSLRSLSQTVRVELSRLDHLMNLIGELGVVQANVLSSVDRLRGPTDAAAAADVRRDLQSALRTMDRKLSLLQQGLLDVRMVPLGQVFDKLARVVRKLGREADKETRLVISGAETELDKLIVEELSDPLMHMIRNCIDHGLESRQERTDTGKSATGRIELRAFQKGNRVVIEVEDDGRGIDWREIRKMAIRRGLVGDSESRELGMQEVIDFIFLPGFTTRESATAVSGRGVGMDVVKTNISRLSGMIDVETTIGRGTKFAITLPVTLAIIQALAIECANQTFCIPLNSVLESIMVRRRDITTVEGHEVISLRGKTLPLAHLDRIFELERRRNAPEADRIYIVIVGLAQHRVGLVVDELLGQQDVVIKPLTRALRSISGIAGATELGAHRTVLLLDVAGLVEEALTRGDSPSPARVKAHPLEAYGG